MSNYIRKTLARQNMKVGDPVRETRFMGEEGVIIYINKYEREPMPKQWNYYVLYGDGDVFGRWANEIEPREL